MGNPEAVEESVVRHVQDIEVKTDPWTDCLVRVRDARDVEQFAALFRHFAPRLKAFLRKSGTTEAIAEETAQEAMAVVWHKAAQFDPARASAATWIFTILRNKQIDTIRKTRRPEPEDVPWISDAQATTAETYETAQEEKRLRAALKVLPHQQRAIIEKAFYGDLSHGEIAEVTGLPLGTIKSRIRLGLEKLRHELASTA